MNRIRIRILGTSAGTPRRDRNVSALAVRLDGDLLLFDCGEGAQQQLIRSGTRFGALGAVFITHLHGDHVYGLPGLLATLSLHGRSAPLSLYGPIGLGDYLRQLVRTTFIHIAYPLSIEEIDGELSLKRPGYSVFALPLEHSVPCLGYSIVEDDRTGRFDVEAAEALGVPWGPLFGRLQRGEDLSLPDGRVVRSEQVVGPPRKGRRVTYCTDTRPCRNDLRLAGEADLLIHEATYSHAMGAEARERGHSTTIEAAELAREAGARRLLLTHFSPRYEDLGALVAEARTVFLPTDAAVDLMELDVLPATEDRSRSR